MNPSELQVIKSVRNLCKSAHKALKRPSIHRQQIAAALTLLNPFLKNKVEITLGRNVMPCQPYSIITADIEEELVVPFLKGQVELELKCSCGRTFLHRHKKRGNQHVLKPERKPSGRHTGVSSRDCKQK